MRGVSIALGEIAFFIGLAGLIGIAIGWVMRDWAILNKAEELDEKLREERANFRRLEDDAAERARYLYAQIAERDELIAILQAGGNATPLVVSGGTLRPGAVIQPGSFGAVPPGTGSAPAMALVKGTDDGERGGGDDLEQIRGVGPTLARRMQEHGITTLQQLAALDDDEVTALADAIRVSPGRIERDDWMGHAAQLLGITRRRS